MKLSTTAPLLQARDLRVSIGGATLLGGVDLDVPRGSIVTVLGKSGAGKSILLKCLAGIIAPAAGSIHFDGRSLTSADRAGFAEFRRRCSYLFQGNALIDSLTAFENVALPLEQAREIPRGTVRARTLTALARLGLGDAADLYPNQMSGGMQKRVALARALVTQPELVLFDEPTTGLDPIRRNAVFAMIARYQRDIGFTAVIVSHDIPEALLVSDRVALLGSGRIRFSGSTDEFHFSADPAIRRFRESVHLLREELQVLRPASLPSLRNLS